MAADPLLFVQEAFPWHQLGLLEQHDGPDIWQADIFTQIRNGLSPHQAIQIAIASGHGPGKSALVAWIVLWATVTKVGTRGVVTANTETQLRTKTWAEVSKWFRLSPILAPLFTLTATALYSNDEVHAKTWRIDAVAWSENKVEAFAGLQNERRFILLVYGEASA